MFKLFSLRLSTLFKLGLGNVASVISYRLLRQAGFYKRKTPIAKPVKGAFFTDSPAMPGGEISVAYFSCHPIRVSSPPDWFFNPWTGYRFRPAGTHWSEIPDFIPKLGDIKTVWELSRFDWLPKMAWAYRNGDKEALGVIELWLRDWCHENPPNCGINWKCGQEAGLRILNMLTAALIIENSFENPRSGFIDFLVVHLERISSTLGYALAQDNNHGISEAAALFAGGSYLACFAGNSQKEKGLKWAQAGRRWLENRAEKLILGDGSFSQHSIIYHRMVMDVLAFVELFRQKLQLIPFSTAFYEKAGYLVEWLYSLLDMVSGDAPNLGSNDGTYLFNMKNFQYRNFQPSIELGGAVFLKKKVTNFKERHPLLELFDVDSANFPQSEGIRSVLRPNCYGVLRHEKGFAMLKLPVYRFRPCHADALHLDIWHDGINWIRDAGTYSYNTAEELLHYFPSTRAHSTASLDDRDQMPRLGRFLFGSWLKPDLIKLSDDMLEGSYTDYKSARHHRKVKWTGVQWIITDLVEGFIREAVIRWHLPEQGWELDGCTLRCPKLTMEIKGANDVQINLTRMPESRYYMDMKKQPVLEVHCLSENQVETIMTFSN